VIAILSNTVVIKGIRTSIPIQAY